MRAAPPLPGHTTDRESPSEHQSLFLTREWFDLLARYGLPRQMERNDALASNGLRLPLIQHGRHFQSLSSYYNADYGLQDGLQVSANGALQLAEWFRSRRARHIDLRPLRQHSSLLHALGDALRQQGYLCDTYHVSTNWYLPCVGMSWTTYEASRPSRLANSLRRCRRKLEAEEGFELEIETSGANLESALTAYASVYARSWKAPEPYPEFIPHLCRLAAEQGWLRLGVLRLGGQAAAAQIWFVKDGTASIYKLAYDSRFAKLGVGTVLTAALTEHVLEVDKVSEIDFLTGDDAYKAEWMSRSRELVGLIAFDARNPVALLKAARHFGRKWLRSILGKKQR